MIGTTLNDRYEIAAELGRGGMGVVYEAADRLLERRVALKVVSAEALGSEGGTRLLDEARAVAQLNHPNIVAVHDAGETPDGPFIVMEWLPGRTLEKVLPLTEEEAVEVARQLCLSLEHAHEHAVIHRDIKPANIIVTPDGTVKLMDFGLARSVNARMTFAGQLVGTLAYISPEQATGAELDHRTDIYSLGVLFYEMFTASLPFTGDDPFTVIGQHINAPVPPPVERNPELAAQLNDLILMMMAKHPEGRPETAVQVREVLDSLATLRLVTRERSPAEAGRPDHNLPAQTTSFIGRKDELTKIEQLLSNPEVRLLTLVGPGGVGKTRLGIRAAGEILETFPGEIFFVQLAAIGHPDLISSTIAETIGFHVDFHSSSTSPDDQLLDYLRDREMLLLLDNFEHLMEGAAFVNRLLEETHRVRLLVTSRESLDLQGEWTYQVRGLVFSKNSGSDVEHENAVELFVDRGRQASPGFEPDPSDLGHVRKICRLVDGLPLAIELAAAWLNVLSVDEIAAEVSQGLDILTSTRRDLDSGHRSLRAVFDRSWSLLDESEQKTFGELSIFTGGFDRQAALEVVGANLLVLAGLARKSFLQRDTNGRFGFHSMMRQFGREKLAEEPAAEQQVRERHARYFHQMVAAFVADLHSPNHREQRARLRPEAENIHEAYASIVLNTESPGFHEALENYLTFLDGEGWHENRLKLLDLLERYQRRAEAAGLDVSIDLPFLDLKSVLGIIEAELSQELTNPISEAELEFLRSQDVPAVLGRALFYLGVVACNEGNYDESIALLTEALPLLEHHERGLGSLLLWLGYAEIHKDQLDAAETHFRRAVKLFEKPGHRWILAFALSKMGVLEESRGNHRKSYEYHAEGRRLLAEYGDLAGEAYTTSRMSLSAFGMRDYQNAYEMGRKGLESFRKLGHRWGIGASYCRIGFAALKLGNNEEAVACFLKTLRKSGEVGTIVLPLYALLGLGCAALDRDDIERALDLLGYCLEHPLLPGAYKQVSEDWVGELKAQVAPDDYQSAVDRQKGRDIKELIREVLQNAEGEVVKDKV